MSFVKVASTKDIAVGEMVGTKIDEKEVLIANIEGNYYAIGDRCTHRKCFLSKGKFEDGKVKCPCHSSVFDVRTGAVVKSPAKTPATVYKTKVENDQVYVEI